MTEERFFVEETFNDCNEKTWDVLDRKRKWNYPAPWVGFTFGAVCNCGEEEDAIAVCELLNFAEVNQGRAVA